MKKTLYPAEMVGEVGVKLEATLIPVSYVNVLTSYSCNINTQIYTDCITLVIIVYSPRKDVLERGELMRLPMCLSLL